jgi:hypothetical protein
MSEKTNHPQPTFTNDLERDIFESAAGFIAVRGTFQKRVRTHYATYEEALSAGTGDGRTMIYAHDKDGRSAHIINV